jgi:hypothetical protein
MRPDSGARAERHCQNQPAVATSGDLQPMVTRIGVRRRRRLLFAQKGRTVGADRLSLKQFGRAQSSAASDMIAQ